MIMAQGRLPSNVSPDEVVTMRKVIKQQPMQDHSKPIKYEVQQERYDGPKKPPMPMEQAVKQVPCLSFLDTKVITAQRALENDFAFFQDIHTSESKCPEYNGYNTRLCSEAGMLPQPQTNVVFLPLVDRPPANPDTIITAIEKGLKLVRAAGEDVLTTDQQLYKVTIDTVPSAFILPLLHHTAQRLAHAN